MTDIQRKKHLAKFDHTSLLPSKEICMPCIESEKL